MCPTYRFLFVFVLYKGCWILMNYFYIYQRVDIDRMKWCDSFVKSQTLRPTHTYMYIHNTINICSLLVGCILLLSLLAIISLWSNTKNMASKMCCIFVQSKPWNYCLKTILIVCHGTLMVSDVAHSLYYLSVWSWLDY